MGYFFNQIKRTSKETTKNVYLYLNKAKLLAVGTHERYKTSCTTSGGGVGGGESISVIVISGQKIVAPNMGDFKTEVWRDGVAYQICQRNQTVARRRWSLNFISGAFVTEEVGISRRIKAWNQTLGLRRLTMIRVPYPRKQ